MGHTVQNYCLVISVTSKRTEQYRLRSKQTERKSYYIRIMQSVKIIVKDRTKGLVKKNMTVM